MPRLDLPPLKTGHCGSRRRHRGIAVLETIAANKPALFGLLAVAPQLQAAEPYAAQLTAPSKVPPQVFLYLQAHGAAVTKAAGRVGAGPDCIFITSQPDAPMRAHAAWSGFGAATGQDHLSGAGIMEPSE
jgi:hypothetical protein